ncbi:hypothetical protein Bca101_050707 [Brassica carinata]
MPVEKTMETVEDPDAEKILEDEDWMANEINYDDDDLMNEDDLLIEDMEHEAAPIVSAKVSKQSTTDGLSVLEESNKLSAKPSPHARSDHRSDARPAQTPSSSSRPSPAKKKRGFPSPLVTGVSLRQRNILVGRISKPKASKNGPKLSPAHTQRCVEERDELVQSLMASLSWIWRESMEWKPVEGARVSMLEREWDPGTQGTIGNRGKSYGIGKLCGICGDGRIRSLLTRSMGILRRSSWIGDKIGIDRKWSLLRSSERMRNPED